MATTVNLYLTFDGNCKEAFDFYRSIFGGEFAYSGTFAEMPPMEGMPPMSDEFKDRIMHISLPISEETTLMGSDTGGEWAGKLQVGNNYSVSVHSDEADEARRIFNALADGGKVNMPFDKTFWQSWFGMLTDKFGVHWMINSAIK